MYQNTSRSFSGRSPRGIGSRSPSAYNSAYQRRRPTRSFKQNIDPRRFVQAAKATEASVYTPTHTFADFAIDELLRRNITAKGYVTPSPIQDQTIPQGLAGRDIVGIANTGTGKTAAFAIPVLQRLMTERDSRALVIAPTRELALQIEEECRSFASGSRLRGALIIGGAAMARQIRDLRGRPNIVIGTPGRLKDHIERGNLDLTPFNIIVLDEVDRMIDMGFINDIRFLLGRLASPRQSFFFSATVDPKIRDLMLQFLSDPVTVSVKTGETADNVAQDVVRYDRANKLDKLHDILIRDDVAKTLIFDETKRSVERLSRELADRGFRVDALHGGKSQSQRERALRKFREDQVDVLVATDVAARGIDIVNITHVINYSTPNTYDDYAHRIGRAGRAGRVGHALTFVEA